jgi:hypothetical protein
MVDKIVKKIKKILKDSDGLDKLDDFEYDKISKMVSILVRSDAEVRKIFYKKTHDLLRAMGMRLEDKFGFLPDMYGIKDDKIIN